MLINNNIVPTIANVFHTAGTRRNFKRDGKIIPILLLKSKDFQNIDRHYPVHRLMQQWLVKRFGFKSQSSIDAPLLKLYDMALPSANIIRVDSFSFFSDTSSSPCQIIWGNAAFTGSRLTWFITNQPEGSPAIFKTSNSNANDEESTPQSRASPEGSYS